MDLIYVTITQQHCEASRYPDFDTVKWIELHSMVTGATNVQNCVVDNLTAYQKEQLNEGKRLFVINEDNNFIGYLITNEAYIEQIKTEENSTLNFGSFKWVPDLASDLEHLVSVTERKHHTVFPEEGLCLGPSNLIEVMRRLREHLPSVDYSLDALLDTIPENAPEQHWVKTFTEEELEKLRAASLAPYLHPSAYELSQLYKR